MRKKLLLRGVVLLFVSLGLWKAAMAKIKVTPIANVHLLGGQYWVSQAVPDSFSANFDAFICPVINFSPKTALLPIYTGLYSGTKDVRELIGGGTLTREMQDHSLALKFVHKLNEDFRIKARVGYKIEYLVETVDESWGNGLFDFNKTIYGIEVEKLWKEWNGRIGIDMYNMVYPNYLSLVSDETFETSIDTTTYSEISSQAGEKVLDYSTMALFIEATHKFSNNLVGTAHYDLSLKNFIDQRVVEKTGEFASTLRSDQIHYLTLGIDLGTPRMTLSLADTIEYYDSNQNSYDAGNSKFIANHYDYLQNAVKPGINFYLGTEEKTMKLSLFWDISYRLYAERLSQNSDGEYQSDKIFQQVNTTGISFTYPINKSLSGKFLINYRDSSSNMRYEKNYSYNYYTFNYFLGINWQL